MLDGIRVLDLTGECGILAPQILADLGADVIAVEPVKGSSARAVGPFLGDVQDPERSLFWWAYSRNKRSIALDVATDAGRNLFVRLAQKADVLFESRPGSQLSNAGIDIEDLRVLAPELIHVTVSPYGLTGPKMHYASSDLTLLASAGVLAITGDEDRPPTRVCVPQAFLHAGADAAVGALVALHERRSSGLGQHVDVSVQQSAALATQSYVLAVANASGQLRRMAGGFNLGPIRIPAVWQALDGHVSLTVLFGKGFAPFTRRLFEYLVESGALSDDMLEIDLETYGERLLDGSQSPELYEEMLAAVADFLATRTKRELFEQAIERKLLLAPIATAADVLGSPHLLAREYWSYFEHPDYGVTAQYPGPFAKFRNSPLEYRIRPPKLGEHSRDVLCCELQIDSDEYARLENKGVVAG